MKFYDKLIMLIEEKGITRNRFTTELNLNRNATQNWQKQGSKPRTDTMSRIAEYFNVSIESLANDDMELEYEPCVKKSHAKELLSYFQRSSSLCGGYVLNDKKINRFAQLLNANIIFLTNLSDKAYNPEMHSVDNRTDVDYSAVFDILELSDRCADNEPQRVIMIQISKVILYWVDKYSEKQDDENKMNLYECQYLSQEKLNYLYTGKPNKNPNINFGFNFTEIATIHNFTSLSYWYLFTGKNNYTTHGHWIKIQNCARCSECRHEVNWGSKDFLSTYCPNCGARMDGYV